jgi:uncharacterized membrane protein YkvA (DUF1232 family)
MFWQKWKARAANLKVETYALYFALRHPAVPWYTKVLIACVVAYAVSPIDLIPDFIPVLGLLDDLLLVPFGIAFILRSLPPAILNECRQQARQGLMKPGPLRWFGALAVVLIWATFAILTIASIMRPES